MCCGYTAKSVAQIYLTLREGAKQDGDGTLAFNVLFVHTSISLGPPNMFGVWR